MKEMESVSISPAKAEERPSSVRSFLLVDEQENLQVKLANVNRASGCYHVAAMLKTVGYLSYLLALVLTGVVLIHEPD